MSTFLIIGLAAIVGVVVFVALTLLGRATRDTAVARHNGTESAFPPNAPSEDDQTAPNAQARRIRQAQERIASMVLDPSIERQLRTRYPHLSTAQTGLVLDGLRQWFELCALVDLAPLSMPSVAVDEAWHAFICSTASYREFCTVVFGRYLDHQPSDASPSGAPSPERDARTWVAACAVEGINPTNPDRLPLLYALDAEVAIPGRTSVDPAAMAALVASTPAAQPAPLVPPGSAPQRAGIDGHPAPQDGPTGHAFGAMDWMTSWLLWRSLLDSTPGASTATEVGSWHATPSWQPDRSVANGPTPEEQNALPDLAGGAWDHDAVVGGCGTPANDSEDGGSGSACSGGGSSCSSGGDGD